MTFTSFLDSLQVQLLTIIYLKTQTSARKRKTIQVRCSFLEAHAVPCLQCPAFKVRHKAISLYIQLTPVSLLADSSCLSCGLSLVGPCNEQLITCPLHSIQFSGWSPSRVTPPQLAALWLWQTCPQVSWMEHQLLGPQMHWGLASKHFLFERKRFQQSCCQLQL